MYKKFKIAFSSFKYISILFFISSCQAQTGDLSIAENANEWFKSGFNAIESRSKIKINPSKAKNVILFVGDGMGISTITAARIYDGQSRGESGEENSLSFEHFPNLALIKTYNVNQQVPDSAGTASAMNTGVKTRAGVLGISHLARRQNCSESLQNKVKTLGEIAKEKGLSTGIVSNMRITHATPASVYAHTPERDWERDSQMPTLALKEGCKDIARQLIEYDKGMDVMFGGGSDNFLGAEYGGKRRVVNDNLIEDWKRESNDRVFISSAEELNNLNINKSSQVMGLFSKDHLKFMLDRDELEKEPTLSEMTGTAIDILSQNKNGYYLMIEGGRIDKGHHAGIAEHALAETQEFSNAIKTALSKVDINETLILVTADHSHVMTIGGYPTRGNPILGLVTMNDHNGEPEDKPTLAKDNQPYTTLGYQNGPGAITTHRSAPIVGKLSTQQALIPTTYHSNASVRETHGGEDVALFAIGPRSHLVGGVLEQHSIYHIIARSLGW